MAEKGIVFLIVTVLVLLTCIVIFAMKYFTAGRNTRLRHSSAVTYRELAERTSKAQDRTMAVLDELRSAVKHIEARLASVEKVLKEVE